MLRDLFAAAARLFRLHRFDGGLALSRSVRAGPPLCGRPEVQGLVLLQRQRALKGQFKDQNKSINDQELEHLMSNG